MLSAFLVTMPAFAEEAGLKRVPVPEWVVYLPDITALSGIGSDEIDRPRYLLREMQFTWEGGSRQIWERQLIEMATDGAATEAGTQIFDYNSALEDFTLTGASLWRDGEKIELWDTPQMGSSRSAPVTRPARSIRSISSCWPSPACAPATVPICLSCAARIPICRIRSAGLTGRQWRR